MLHDRALTIQTCDLELARSLFRSVPPYGVRVVRHMTRAVEGCDLGHAAVGFSISATDDTDPVLLGVWLGRYLDALGAGHSSVNGTPVPRDPAKRAALVERAVRVFGPWTGLASTRTRSASPRVSHGTQGAEPLPLVAGRTGRDFGASSRTPFAPS